MESAGCVRLYQHDYDKLKELARQNNTSIADAVHQILSGYIQLTTQGPQFVHVTQGGMQNGTV